MRTPAIRKAPALPIDRQALPENPQAVAIAQRGSSLAERALQVRIVDDASYQRAVVLVKAVKQYETEVEGFMDPIRKAAYDTWQLTLKQTATLLSPAKDAEKHIKGEIDRHDAEQRRLRDEEEAARLQEQIRLEQAERERVAAEEARLRAEAEATRKREAEAVAAAGDVVLARRIAETPVEIAPVPQQPVFVPPAQTVVSQADGVKINTTYVARVTSLATLVQALDVPCAKCGHKGAVALTTIKPDQAVLDKIAKALRESFNIPGVEAVPVRTVGVKV